MKIKKVLVAVPLMGILLMQPTLVAAESRNITSLNAQSVLAFNEDGTAERLLIDPSSEEWIDKWVGTVVVEGASLNVRKGPSTSHEIIGKLQNGDTIDIVEQLEEWVKFTYNDSFAFLSKSYIAISKLQTPVDNNSDDQQDVPEEPDEQLVEKWIGTIVVENANLNIRKGPSISDEIVGKLQNGTKVEIVEQFDEWVKIPYNGSVAYISKPFVTISRVLVKPSKEKKKIIVLDPGHGGIDSGAKAIDGTHESTLVWTYTTKAKEMLEKAGYNVYLTRSEKNSCTKYKKVEEELACRSAIPAKVNADIYISIHADANKNKNFRGTVTFYNGRNDYDGNQNPYPENSKLLANLIHSQVQPIIGSNDRGVKNDNYYVTRMNSVPSVLIELACLTNAADLKLLKNSKKPEQFAAALTKAIGEYYQM